MKSRQGAFFICEEPAMLSTEIEKIGRKKNLVNKKKSEIEIQIESEE